MNNPDLNGWISVMVVVAVIALIYSRRPWRPSRTAHGTARPAYREDLKRAGMLAGKGLLLGRELGKRSKLISMPRYVHLAVFARTSAGKGVSFLIPWLLTWWRGSTATLDFKAELYRATAAKRRKMGQKVVRLDPFGGPGADSFNPLDLMGSGPDCIDDARAATEAMVVRTGEEKDPHWNDQAANVITAILDAFLASQKREGRQGTPPPAPNPKPVKLRHLASAFLSVSFR